MKKKIYIFNDYVCEVEDFGTEGIVTKKNNPDFRRKLIRGDYQVEHCSFPITFFERENQTFLIHGTDWNRLDITLLEENVLLTDRVVDYESQTNYFDYFHSKLHISPDGSHFISNGWFWGPMDALSLFSVDDFLKNYELSFKMLYFDVTSGYNWDRPLCWIDNQTIAIGYNLLENEEIKISKQNISELIYLNVFENKITKRVPFPALLPNEYGEVKGEIYYDKIKDNVTVSN